jgi:hypothetical protein
LAARRWFVKRFVGHSDRLVVLPDDGSGKSSWDDGYARPPSLKAEPSNSDPRMLGFVSPHDKRTCPECGREVRYNLTRAYFYSHTLSDSVKLCRQSGK